MVPRLNIAINFLKVNAHLSYTHIPIPCIKLPFRARQWLGQNLCKVQLQEWKLCVDMVCVRMYSMNTYRLPLFNSRGKWGPLWANTRSFYAGMSLCACERTSVCVCVLLIDDDVGYFALNHHNGNGSRCEAKNWRRRCDWMKKKTMIVRNATKKIM